MDYYEFWGKATITKSVTLYLPGTKIMSNGKGIDEDYALASAYTEFMERFNNLAHLRFNNDIVNNDISNANGTKIINMKSILEENMVMNKFLDIINITEIESHINYLNSLNSQRCSENEFPFITFQGLINKEDVLEVPLDIINLYYGTNGLCAGDTKEEALVQGLSEIIERDIIYKIISKKLRGIDATNYVKNSSAI